MRIKIIRATGNLRKGQIVNLPKTEALALILSGKAIMTKDLTSEDMRTNGNIK